MKRLILGTLAGVAACMVAGAPADAADNIMKVCGAKYQAAKTAKTLPAGQTWNQYLASCRAAQPKTVAAAPAPAATAPAAKPVATAAAPAKSGWLSSMTRKSAAATPAAAAAPAAAPAAAKAPGTQSPAMAAVHDRQRQCGAQWKADKAAGKTGTQTWPQYWSACNTRLKG